MNIKKLNVSGIAHFAALAVVVVGLAGVGTFMLVRSHAATCTTYTFSSGSQSVCVKYIQTIANSRAAVSPKLSTDGIFGSKTKYGVQQFQRSYLLTADGVVGPHTWGALCRQGVVAGYTSAAYYAANSSGCYSASTE